MPPLLNHHNDLLLDACVLINLYASSRLQEIVEALQVPRIAVGQIAIEECRFIYSGPVGDEYSQKSPIELDKVKQSGVLHVVDFANDSERERYIALAMTLDDGEAQQLAIAWERQYAIATDERRALRVFRQESPNLPSFTTLDLLHHWATQTNVNESLLRTVIYNIRRRARFQPRSDVVLYDWWEKFAPS